MKKYWTIGSKQLIIHWLTLPTILFLLPVVAIPFSNVTIKLFFALVYCGFIVLVRFLIIPNAFCISKLDELTIQNKNLTIAWEKIENIEICPIRFQYGVGIFKKEVDLDSVICIGNPSKLDFINQQIKKSVFVPMSRKNMQALKKYGGGKSEKLDEVLQQYSSLYE